MSDVKRFKHADPSALFDMLEDDNGDYVRYAEYDELQAKIEALTIERDNCRASIDYARETMMPVFQDSNRPLEAMARGVVKLQAENKRQADEIERLQIALDFWLPSVPSDDAEIAERAGNDAMLLTGLDVDTGMSAEELGWTVLRAERDQLKSWQESVLAPDRHGAAAWITYLRAEPQTEPLLSIADCIEQLAAKLVEAQKLLIEADSWLVTLIDHGLLLAAGRTEVDRIRAAIAKSQPQPKSAYDAIPRNIGIRVGGPEDGDSTQPLPGEPRFCAVQLCDHFEVHGSGLCADHYASAQKLSGEQS